MADPSDDLASIASGFQGGDSASAAPQSPDADLASIAAGFQGEPTDQPSAPKPKATPPHPMHAPTRFQQAGAKPTPNEPELSWGEVGSQALKNALPSLGGVAQSIGNAILHPGQTIQGIEQLGTGLALQAGEKLGYSIKPEYAEQAAQAKAVAQGLESHYGQTYGSVRGFKKALATDPASIAMDAATALEGVGAGAKAAGLARTAGALSKTASAIDPVSNAVRLAGLPAKALSNPVTRQIQQVTTDVPAGLLKVAKQAGETTDPVLRDAFLRHYNGQGTAGEYLQTAQKALAKVKQDASDQYLAGKGNLINEPVDFSGTYQALDAADKELGMGAAAGFPAAKQAIADARAYVDSVANQENPAARNLVNADALKQQLWDLRDSVGNDKARQQLGKIYNAVKGDIGNVDPAYQALMEQYQDGLNNLTDITKTFGLGRNPAASATLAKGLRALKKGSGEDILSQLSEAEPTLPYMMAGSALSPWSAGGARNALEAGVTFPWAVAIHNPAPIVAQAAMQSPKLAGAINYASGAAGRAGTQVAASPLARGAYYSGRIGQEQEAPNMPVGPTAPATSATQIAPLIAHAEGQGKNPQSSAKGKYQFTDSTFVQTYKEMFPDRAKGMSDAQILALRQSPQADDLYDVMGPYFTQKNMDTLKSNGIEPTAANTYVTHVLGQNGGLKTLLADEDTPMENLVSPKAIAANARIMRGKTAGEFKQWAEQRMQQASNALVQHSATGGRIGRAKGGAAKKRSHEELVQRLMAMAKSAKLASTKDTKPLLKVPDNTIAKALDIAQQAL